MFYREFQQDENLNMGNGGMAGQQEMYNENQTNPMQQSQMGMQGMPFMCYPMMSGMYNPSMYGAQMPQQQYQTTGETARDMERTPYHHNYNYHHNYHHSYYPYNNYYYPNYSPYYNFYPSYPWWFGEDYEY